MYPGELLVRDGRRDVVRQAVNGVGEVAGPPAPLNARSVLAGDENLRDGVARILVAGQNRTGIQGSRRPANLAEAIHSLSYYVAAAVADKDFTWAHASETKYSDPRIVKLMDLVDVDPAPPPVKYMWSWGGTVTIVTTDGKRFTSTVDAPRGSGPRGIAWSDVEAKYRALMPESKLPARRIDDALSLIHGLERVKNVSELTRLLAPGR